MASDADKDRQEFAEQLVLKAQHCLGPMPADQPQMEALRERLDTLAFSLMVTIEGGGGLEEHRLSPKGQPQANLAGISLHNQWSWTTTEDLRVRRFLVDIQGAIQRAQADGGEHREVMGRLLVGVCRVIEDGYELAPRYFDDNGGLAGERDDIAPGLAAAVEVAWTEAS